MQSEVFEQALNNIGDTIEDMDKEIEHKDNETEFLENKLGLPDCKVIQEMNRLRLSKVSSERKGDRIMDRLSNYFKNHKYIKNKKL